MRPRVSGDQIAQRIRHARQKRIGQTCGRHHSQCIAESGRVLSSRVTRLASNSHLDNATVGRQFFDPTSHLPAGRSARIAAQRKLVVADVANAKQQLVQCDHVFHRVATINTMQFQRELRTPKMPARTLKYRGMRGALREMLAYLRKGTVPQTECHDNIKSLAMVFAAIESSKRRRRLPVRAM